MLINCPECKLQVSDKAVSCPHCGYPLQPSKISFSRSNRKKRLPNGFGQITKLNNPNLRKPFRAMVNKGFTDLGKPISKLLKPVSYFETYNEAYEALLEYNKNPYDPNKDITLHDLFVKWYLDCFTNEEKSSNAVGAKTAWKHCNKIQNIKVTDCKSLMIKDYIEGLEISSDAKARVKSLLNRMFDYAVSMEVIDKNIVRNFSLSQNIKKDKTANVRNHIPFTDEEVNILWQNSDNLDVQMILIQCYMGWRPRELCGILNTNIDFDANIIKGGMKTKAGTNRIVPIHHAILQFIKNRYDSSNIMLFNKCQYRAYLDRFTKTIKKLNINEIHTPHDCRSTFITNCKKYNVNEYAIKYIVGHKINDITEAVYTKRELSWYQEEIEKIKEPLF